MTDANQRNEVALIVGGGPGISASCARLFAGDAMRVAVAARNPDKSVLEKLEQTHGIRRYACDASDPAAVAALFRHVTAELGTPRLVVHNIDGRVAGIFRKGITEADPGMVLDTLRNSAFSALQRCKGHDHLHECERRAEGLCEERRVRDGLARQARARGKHGEGTDARRHPRRACTD